jgi:hypothetical protein
VRAGARAHELERDRLAEGAVDGLVDLAHAPRADLLDQRVAIAEALAGGDSERSDPARRRAGNGGGGCGGDVVGKGRRATGRTVPSFRHRVPAVRATHGSGPIRDT